MAKIKIGALGGLNEIGKNMYIVSVDDRIFIFDAGSKYADDKLFGVEYIIPNYEYLIENKDKIEAIFITHGSDNKIGALSDLLKDLPDIKIYAGKFTLEIIKQRLEENEIHTENLFEVKQQKPINFGDNSIFAIQISHALPDSYLYVLNTKDGSIVFTGNYIFDPTMLGHYGTDIGKLAYIGKQNVLCLMSESLYADKKGYTSPNHRADHIFRDTLTDNEGRILINVFDSQMFKIQELLNEILKTDRNVVIMGKSLENTILNGIDLGYVDFNKERIKSISHVNDDNIVVIISNEKQKPYISLKRILRGSDKFVTLTEKDTVLIVSPVLDAHEVTATNVFNEIAKLGSKLIIASKKTSSLYASSEDIMLMIKLMNPKYYFPVNGEYRHQAENARLAMNVGIDLDNIILNLNGEFATFVDGALVDNSESIKTEDVLIDGNSTNDIGDLVLKDREVLSESGLVVVNANIDRQAKSIINKVNIVTKGFIYVKDNIDMIKEAEDMAKDIILDNLNDNYIDFNKIKNSIREKLGKYFYKETESKPMILIIIQEF